MLAGNAGQCKDVTLSPPDLLAVTVRALQHEQC